MSPTNYAPTLNLPKTDFQMKADLPKREPLFLAKWQKLDIHRTIIGKAEGSRKYVLHDGPPYANGDIHIGHALNKILKDMIIKYRSMRGYLSCYVPGWDCHGLPVEHALFKELGLTKNQISQQEFRKKAHDYAMRYVNTQREQFRRLGIFGDWEDPYLTLARSYEAEIVRSFGKLVRGGYIYKGLKPVNWCCVCETALAEAEVEHENHNSPSIYVKFKVAGDQDNTCFVIWTTTPWTLLANVAVAVHPDREYAFMKVSASGAHASYETWVIMKDLAAAAMEKFGVKDYEIVKTAKGSELEGIACRHPFIDRESRVVLAAYVSNVDGTGCVHTAPGHGQEDYITGLKYKLPIIMPVDTKGVFDKTAGEFSGAHVFKANGSIIEKLTNIGALIFTESIAHSYPHCWRCKEPIIFRATPQWFMGIDHNDLRKKMLDVINRDVKWVPGYGRERIRGMVENRPDWCLSRQRLWGVPIIAFYCKACGKELLDADIIEHIAGLVEREGVDIWFSREETLLLPKGTSCKHCSSAEFRKEMDIMDVWFDSGVSHQAVLKKRPNLGYPADLYLEGSDQHRGWFQSALITAMGIEGEKPFKTVLTHGFVVDGEGKKMSKSVGNVVSPLDVIKDYGADILRLWVASSDYSEDIRISAQILTRLADAYRKIRNTYRFILGNMYDFDIKKDAVRPEEMPEIDRWALSETYKLLESVNSHYEAFSFHEVFHAVYNFCVVQLSSFYLDILKDRLYISQAKSIDRRSAQTALYEILGVITKVISPILVFTTDEVWQNYHRGDPASCIHLTEWPDLERLKSFYDPELEKKWACIIKVREEVLKALEHKREVNLIGSSLEARVSLYSADAGLKALLGEYRQLLPSVFIVSEIELLDSDPADAVRSAVIALSIRVDKASGIKCVRCWNYKGSVGKNSAHPQLCDRCVNVVEGDPK